MREDNYDYTAYLDYMDQMSSVHKKADKLLSADRFMSGLYLPQYRPQSFYFSVEIDPREEVHYV